MKYLKFKNLLSFSMAAMMILSSAGTSFGQVKFNDLANAKWAEEKIVKWSEQGLVAGYEDNTFRPQANITRAEFATLVYNSYKLSSPSVKSFADVNESDWYYSIVGQMAQLGFLSGYEDNTFRPEAPITRAEAAAILAQINKLTSNSEAAAMFADYNNISDWSKGFVGAVVEKNYMAGYPDKTFKAQNFITRAEAVVTLDNSLNPQQAPALPQETITAPGTYGGTAVEYKIINGSLEVKSKDVKLENMVIEGDLILGQEIGEGDVTLSNVTVKGKTYVYGGGVSSIYIINSFLQDLYVDKANDAVRIVAQGSSTFGVIYAKSGVVLEEKDLLNSQGFVSVVIEADATGEIVLNGKFDKVEVNAEGITLRLSDDTVIQLMVINETISVVGSGAILTAQLYTNTVTFEVRPENVLNRTNGQVTIIVDGKKEYIISTGGGGGGGGGGSSSPSTPVDSPDSYDYKVFISYNNKTIMKSYADNETIDFTLLEKFYDAHAGDFAEELASSDGIITKLLNLQTENGNVYAQIIAEDMLNYMWFVGDLNIVNLEDDEDLLIKIKDARANFENIKDLARRIADNDLSDIKADIEALYPGKSISDIEGLELNSYSKAASVMLPLDTTIVNLEQELFSRLNSSTLYDVSGKDVLEIEFEGNVFKINVQKEK